jgi:lipopolysaccharide transport system permease protein
MNREVRIRPDSGLARDSIRDLWQYRDLLSMLVWRDITVRYKQTLLGPIWFLLQPLLPTMVFTIVFGRIAGMSTDGVPGFLFFLCNQIIWGYFSANYLSTAGSLYGNLHLFTKVYFPRIVVPLASLVSNAAAIGVQLGFFAIAWCWYRYGTTAGANLRLSPALFLAPLLFVLAAAQGLGFGLWMAAATGKYRDLSYVSPILIQMWMYASAVVFPISQVPPQYRRLVLLNPVTFLSEALRVCLLGAGTISWGDGLYSVAATAVVLASGLHVYNRAARVFVDIA